MEQQQNPPPPPSRHQDTSTAPPLQSSAAPSGHHSEQPPPRLPHLSIDIPAAPPASLPDHHLLITPPPAAVSSSSSRALRSPSFKLVRQTVRSLWPPAGSFNKLPSASKQGLEAPGFSARRLFGGNAAAKVMGRTSSLPLAAQADPGLDHAPAPAPSPSVSNSNQAAAADNSSSRRQKPAAAHLHICRSQSLPMSMKKLNTTKSFKRMDSLGGMFRVVPSTPRTPAASASTTTAPAPPPDIVPSSEPAEMTATAAAGQEDGDDGGEDIPEEEAVCRICMEELAEGSDTTLKLECACKGELALAHKDCALRWFGTIKGTRTCEVCKREVQNLPVTLMRVQSAVGQQQRDGAGSRSSSRYDPYRVWHGTPILVIISILAYFCFLERLLVANEGIAALAISLPFSCILGLFSSLTTTSMVARRYVWIYAAVQFLFVVIFTHLFYRYLHLQAVISIILATFAGFGVGMTGNSIIVEILRWRARRVAPSSSTPARRRRRRTPHAGVGAQQQASASSGDQPSSGSAADGRQREAVAAGDIENPAVALPQA